MRGCEADRCDAGATVDGRWCERHEPHGPIAKVHRILATSDYAEASEKIAELEAQLDDARATRVRVLATMREKGMSLGDIAKVTGLTRQRIGQLLKYMP